MLAVLVIIAIPTYGTYLRKSRTDRAIAEIRNLEVSIDAYRLEHEGQLPNTLADVGRGGLNDPWGHAYRYLRIEGGGFHGSGPLRKDRFVNPLNSDYDLYSVGEDGVTMLQLNNRDSQDDVVRANNGGFVGLASEF